MDSAFDLFEKTPANFRALRDMVGFKQDEFADIVGVDRSEVRRWDAGKAPVSEAAWNTLRAMVEEHFALVRALMGDIACKNPTEDSTPIVLPYYRSGADYTGNADWMSANKASHAAAERLLELGYRVNFVYSA